MATSGTINNTFRTGYAVRITWTVTSQNVANNTSTVTANVQLVSLGSSYTINSSATKNGSLTVNGTTYNFTFSAALTGNQTKTIYTKTGIVVPHNSDGTKTCSFSCVAGIAVTLGGTYYASVTASGTGAFNAIARASSISSVTASVEVNGTNACTVGITRASSSFTHTVEWKIGSYSKTTTGVGTSASYAIPTSWMNAIPNATSGTATVTVTTYSGTTKIGNAVSTTFKIAVPSSVVPSISSVSISEAVAGIASKFGAFVQNKSKLNVAITASGIYGSTITNYKSYIQAIEYHGNSFVSGVISASGTIGVVTIVTDSRGRTARYDGNITILPYTIPTISAFSAYRCNSSGVQDYEGQHLKINLNFLIANVNNLNDKYYEVVYRLKGATTWSAIESGNIYSKNTDIITGALFSPDYAYDLALNINDYFGEAHATIDIPTAFTLVDYHSSGKGIAFGKVAENENTMEISLDVDILGELLQENKKAPTLLNNWQNYGAAYDSASYWKDKCNVVHISGVVKGGTVSDGTVIFTLPVGYRPTAPEKFITVSVNAICVLDIYANGNVTIRAGANTSWVSLSGISFRTV
ncbi:DUF859 family phage minor structural protein [Bacillus infantis]|uniref:DUF859 family phage minor structural protein n=1 Tax=Bacillus infantis TaxID=324767 RepID=UPI003CEACB4C